MKYQDRCDGTCSKSVGFDIEDGVIKNVWFGGGCHGNLQGISKLVDGMAPEEVVKRLKGVDCSGKGTSCPDQLARAIEKVLKKSKAV